MLDSPTDRLQTCFFGWSISLTILCVKGGERHIQDVAALGIDTITEVQLLNWTSQVFGIIGVCAGKVSVSAMLLAIIARTQRRWQRYYLWTFCVAIAIGAAISCSILTFAQCRPAAALWDSRVKGVCLDPEIMADFGTFMGGKLLCSWHPWRCSDLSRSIQHVC